MRTTTHAYLHTLDPETATRHHDQGAAFIEDTDAELFSDRTLMFFVVLLLAVAMCFLFSAVRFGG